MGKRPYLSVFGTDYPTPDGTGVRDYIHVEDLATAHLNALDYLRGGGESLDGELSATATATACAKCCRRVEKIAGLKLDIREEPRRAGDPPSLVAKCDKVRQVLGGSRGSTTSTPSCAPRSSGKNACNASPGS